MVGCLPRMYKALIFTPQSYKTKTVEWRHGGDLERAIL